jgi:hypothetical protein
VVLLVELVELDGFISLFSNFLTANVEFEGYVFKLYVGFLLLFFAFLFLLNIIWRIGRFVLKYWGRDKPNAYLDRHARAIYRKRGKIELDILDIEHDQIKFQKRYAKSERRFEKKFDRERWWHKIGDTLSAFMAATAPRSSLKSEAIRFRDSIQHHGLSVVMRTYINHARMIESAKLRLAEEESKSEMLQISFRENLDFVDGHQEYLDKEISAAESPTDEEVRAENRLRDWEHALGRPAYAEKYITHFEQTMKKWLDGLRNLDGSESGKRKNNFGIRRNGLMARIYVMVVPILRSFFSEALNIFKFFPFFGIPAELFYAFPAFQALANGQPMASAAGTVVFVLGLYQLGELTGLFILRSQSHKIIEKRQVMEVKPKANFFAMVLAALLFGVAIFGIWSGASLRAVTGDLIRLNSEILADQFEIDGHFELLNSVELDDRTLQAERVRTTNIEVDALRASIVDKSACRSNLIKQTDCTLADGRQFRAQTPLGDPEGWLALFIYFILFAGAVAKKIFEWDRVFEFGLAQKQFFEIKGRRLSNLFHLSLSKIVFKLVRTELSANLKNAQSQASKISARNKQIDEKIIQLKSEYRGLVGKIRSFVQTRTRKYCNILIRLRLRSDEGAAEDLLSITDMDQNVQLEYIDQIKLVAERRVFKNHA